MRYERLVNPSRSRWASGEVTGYLDHYPFSKGIGHWIDRHNSYSRFEAEQIVANRQNGGRVSLRKALAGSDFHERRITRRKSSIACHFGL